MILNVEIQTSLQINSAERFDAVNKIRNLVAALMEVVNEDFPTCTQFSLKIWPNHETTIKLITEIGAN
jgi:hypothetical protein